MADLIAITAAIEATIPFRASNENGQDCTNKLANQVLKQGARFLDWPESELLQFVDHVMHEAIILANQDVLGFAEPDPAKFLSATCIVDPTKQTVI